MVRINWTFQAKSYLKDIAEYISKDSKLYAKRQVFQNQKPKHSFIGKKYLN